MAIAPLGRALAHRNRRARRGQTLVEYALIVAYVSLMIIQGMSILSFHARAALNAANCTLVIAQASDGNLSSDANKAKQMAAVYAFLTDRNNWGDAPDDWIIPAASDIYVNMYYVVYGS